MTAISDPPSATVVLDGEIDIATAPAIRRILLAAISGGNVHLAVNMSGSPSSTPPGSASWSPRLTGRGKREVACRCWRRPGRCGGCWTSCTWTRSCRQPSALPAPSPPAAPPDASPGLPQRRRTL